MVESLVLARLAEFFDCRSFSLLPLLGGDPKPGSGDGEVCVGAMEVEAVFVHAVHLANRPVHNEVRKFIDDLLDIRSFTAIVYCEAPSETSD